VVPLKQNVGISRATPRLEAPLLDLKSRLPVGMSDRKRAGSPPRERERHLVLLLLRLPVPSPLRDDTATQLGKLVARRVNEVGSMPCPGPSLFEHRRRVTHNSRLLRRILT
jgi:hypothetical protein